MNILPLLIALFPPTNAMLLLTAGSDMTISLNWRCFTRIASNDTSWDAWIDPLSRPVSCCGKNPLGTLMIKYRVEADRRDGNRQGERLMIQYPTKPAIVACDQLLETALR